MVFEALVTDVLNKVLGDYIENLDRKQLKIGIWGGDVVLQNLKIRESALDDLDLPVQLIYGYLGKLVLKIPWKNLYSQPVIVKIENLYGLVMPNNNVKYSAAKQAKYEMDIKKAALDALEAARKKELEKDAVKPDAGFAEKLTAQIVNNLQVQITNVHLRYEDTTTTGSPFSFGISLHELELYTTDDNWEKCYMAQQASQVFKIANLSCLSAYLNCGGNLYNNDKSQLSDQFQVNIARKDVKPLAYDYVLGPISCNAKLKLNMNPEFDDPPFEIPKIDLTMEMEKLNVGLTNIQFENLIKLGDAMNRQQLALPYRKYRPHGIPYKGHAKEWWQFAITCVLEENIRKPREEWSWNHMKAHRDRCHTYAQKYKELSLSKKPPAVLTETCRLLEVELDLMNLLMIRQRVNIEIAKQREAAPETTEKAGWFGGWWGGDAKKDDKTEGQKLVEKFEAAMTSEEKAKMYSAIGYQENAKPTDLPEQYEAIRMNFKLVALEVGLYQDDRLATTNKSSDFYDLPSLVLLKFKMAKASITQRPAGEAISISAGMRELQVTGLKRNDYTPLLVESKITDEFNLLDVFFETNPLDKRCDQRVKVVARPLQIVYDAPTVLALINVFKAPDDVTLSKFENAASYQMSSFKERSATGMQYMIDKKSVLDADILLMPNILVVPQNGTYVAEKSSLIVLSMGQVHISSTPRRSSANVPKLFAKGEDKEDILKLVMDNAYDKFTVKLDDVQIMVVRSGEPWQTVLKVARHTEMHVLRPVSLKVTAALCVVDNDPRLPKIKVDIDLPAIMFNISEDRVILAIKVATSIPLPQQNTTPRDTLLSSRSSRSSMTSISNFINKEVKKITSVPAGSKQPMVHEVVQYTNLDVRFSLGEIYFGLFQSSKRSESTSDISVEFLTPDSDVNSTSMVEPTSPPEPVEPIQGTPPDQILSIHLRRLEAHFIARTYESVATAKLGDINLRQYETQQRNMEVLDVIYTPVQEEGGLNYLFTVSCTLADKTSPEFSTKYNSTEQLVVANFKKLHMVLHQECLKRLMEVAGNFQNELAQVMEATSMPRDRMSNGGGGDGIRRTLEVILEDTEQIMTSNQMKRRKNARQSRVVESVKVRVIANLDEVALTLTSRNRPLAEMNVKKFVSSMTLKSSYTEVNIGLKDIQVIDLNPNTIHKNILSIVGKDAFNCQLVMYNKEETLDYNSDDMKITVDIGCMKIMFLNWFVAGVLNFLNNFKEAQKALSDASAAAAESARQKAMDAYDTATRLNLNIRIKAPVIVVPACSHSTDALCLDLGLLELTNNTTELQVPNEERLAVLDEIKLHICDVKISKVIILDGNESTVDDVDAAFGFLSKGNMMNPMSCNLLVTRNLSYTWYKDVPELNLAGRLKSIELTLFADDYALVISVMNRNLSEGLEEFPPIDEPPPEPQRLRASDRQSVISRPPREVQLQPKQQKIHESIKFNFQFDGVIVNLMESETDGLARFGIYFLSIKGTKLDNNTLSTSIVLCNIQMEDTRTNSTSKIRQYLSRKDWMQPNMETEEIIDACYNDLNFMVDVTAIIKENDTFAEVRVRGFDMIVCIDFLLKLTTFLALPPEKDSRREKLDINETPRESRISNRSPVMGTPNDLSTKVSEASKGSIIKKVNIILHIDEPDIILVENLEDLNTSCIIFNAQAHLNYRCLNEKQIINGQIDGLKMYMCAFLPERREMTRHYILHPCVISLQGSTPEEEGMHVSLKLSDIIINVSPATIELLNKAMVSVTTGTMAKAAIAEETVNYSNLWLPNNFNNRTYWFTRVEKAVDALEMEESNSFDLNQKTEKCVIEVPSITLVIESGVGYYTKPLISLDTRITAVFNNWSRNLTAQGSLTLNMNYYNQALAEWEPIIELDEVETRTGVNEYVPWELMFVMGMEKVQTEVDDDSEQQALYMKINSAETLEITLSKTCLGLLNELGEAFSQAMDQKGLTKPDIVAPYVLENDTGFDITLDLQKGIFTLHEVHRCVSPSQNNKLVLTANECEVDPSEIKTCTISSGGRAYLQTKDLSTLSEEESEDYSIYVTIGEIPKEIALPVSKSDTRYFNLMRSSSNEPWGIVSQVKQEYGTTKINIHGVVSVHNHFTTTLSIYRRNLHPTRENFEDVLVGRVRAGDIFHVPLHAIYAESKELYFSMRGYRTSVQGVSWGANPSDLNYSQQIQCDPVKTFEPLFINARRTKTEIYHENTNKYTILSAVYIIHLRPPLYLRNSLPIDIQVSVAGCSVRKEDGLEAASSVHVMDKGFIKEDFLDYGEKEVNSGDVLHLPTVRLVEKGKEARSFLVVRLLQYLEKDWSCATEVYNYTQGLTTWTFSSYDSEMRVDMELYVLVENRHGSMMLTLYSPFWMINKTGQMLTYKTDTTSVEVLYHPPEYSGPILFTFRDKFFFDKKKASIRCDNGDWSEKIPLDVAGAIGQVTCEANNQKYHIGVHNHLTQNSLTKQITFIPFYIVCNKCRFDIELQEQSRPGDPWLHLEPGQFEPLWPKNDLKNNIVVRVEDKITPAFDYTEVICTLLKLENSKYGGINVDVQTTEGGVYITFTDYKPADAPGLLINHTGRQVLYYEKGTKNEQILNAKSTIMYAWDDPTGPKMLVFGANKEETDLKRDGIGEVIMQDGKNALWVSFLDGLQRVVLFTEDESIAKRTESTASLQTITQSIDLRIHGIGLSVINNETGLDILYLGVTSSGIIWESKKVTKKRFKEMTIHDNTLIEAEYQRYLLHKNMNEVHTYTLDNKFPIDFGRMILKKTTERDIERSFYPAIWVSRKSSPFQNQLHVKINRIQVDNQFLDPIFPVVLAPIAPPKSVANTTTLKPFIECSMVQRIMPNSTVRQFKYAKILIQEFHFKVDLNFLMAIAEMFEKEVSDEVAAKQFRQDVESIELPLSTFFEEHSLEEQKSFYDSLHLGPLKIHVSFSMAGSDTKALPGFLGSLLQGVGVTLTDVNDVVFRLAFFEREYQFFTQEQLIKEVTSHYKGQALKQLYVLVLGLDVLGNPYGLVVGLKKGVEDLFYEPFQGAIQGPGEFAEGLMLGVKSLFGHTVGGAAGAMSKITGAMGKGLAVLTFDEEYQRKRRQGMHNKPKNFHEGLARSSKGLVMGFVDGVTGVVTKPVSGAREHGVEGFFKGLGKGAIGLVARPTAGVVDFASGSFDAVKRAAEASEDVKRMRPTRFQHHDFVLRPYCYMEAMGNKILKETDKGKFASTDCFIHNEPIIQKAEYLLVTNYRLIYVQRNEMFGIWTSLWSYLWDEITSVEYNIRGVQITVKGESKKVLGLFNSKESPRKLVLVGDERKRRALVDIIESHRLDPNPQQATISYPTMNF